MMNSDNILDSVWLEGLGRMGRDRLVLMVFGLETSPSQENPTREYSYGYGMTAQKLNRQSHPKWDERC